MRYSRQEISAVSKVSTDAVRAFFHVCTKYNQYCKITTKFNFITQEYLEVLNMKLSQLSSLSCLKIMMDDDVRKFKRILS